MIDDWRPVTGCLPFFAASRPLVFAHRGGAALQPENTLAAFAHGLSLGADGVELDVHLSRDGVVVVHHDRTLDRTTGLSGPVSAVDAASLQRAGIPTLAAVLACTDRARVIVELKQNRRDLAVEVVADIRRAEAMDRVCVASFGQRALAAVRQLQPAIATSASRQEVRWALYRSWCHLPVSRVRYGGYQIPEYAGRTHVVTPRFVGQAHDAGLRVQVWTVDSDVDARRLLAWGVDALITDRPDIIVPIVRTWNCRR
jgi:glycerophosphoryl diester phosphodiesterase